MVWFGFRGGVGFETLARMRLPVKGAPAPAALAHSAGSGFAMRAAAQAGVGVGLKAGVAEAWFVLASGAVWALRRRRACGSPSKGRPRRPRSPIRRGRASR